MEKLTKEIKVEPLDLDPTTGEISCDPLSVSYYRGIRLAAHIAADQLGKLDPETNILPEELQALEEVKVYADLRYICDVMKLRRGHAYPPDWRSAVYNSGLYDKILERINSAQ